MSDWGIPDWRDAKAYGDTDKWTFMRWRWEFCRRREDLRAFFDANAEETHRYYLELYAQPGPWDGGRTLSPNEPGFTASGFHHEVAAFGYAGVPNPRISEQPAHVIFSVLDYPGGSTSFIKGAGPRWPEDGALQVSVAEGQLAAIFDLDKPLGPQLEGAKEHLVAMQAMLHGKPLQKRRHPAKWLTYLRVLDAREVEASWSEITAILPRTAQKGQSARDTWEQARALCFNF